MKRFIILVCLVAVQFAQGAHVKRIRKLAGNDILLDLKEHHGELNSCVVITNVGEEFHIFPRNAKNDEDYVINYLYVFDKCLPVIKKATPAMSGKWVFKQTFKGNEKHTEKIVTEELDIQIRNVLEEKQIIPSSPITVQKGHYAIFRISERFPNLQSCILVMSKDEYDLSLDEFQDIRIKEPGVCGVRIPATFNESGTFYLYADVGDYETYYGSILIDVVNDQDYITQPESIFLELGKNGNINFGQSNLFTYCQLEDPNGKKYPVQAGTCSYTIPTITKFHDGIWIANYGIIGSNNPMETKLKIVTFDNPLFNATVTYTENKHINLLCSVQGTEIEYCKFTRPDSYEFSVSPGVGNGKYDYYGGGFKRQRSVSSNTYDCGLTIREPTKNDFGAWKCMIQVSGKTTGAVLRTDHLTEIFRTQDVKTYGSKVYVQRGNSYTVKCSAEAALNYCWLYSPNGTVYSVSEVGNNPSRLTYVGSGLRLGECGAIIKKAEDTHMGEWSCHMGIINGTEVESSISVIVTDSLLIPDEDTIDIYHKNITILTCKILPGDENTINYCRWIRPDGHGIYNNLDNQYVTEQTLSSCKLTIQELNVYYDVGTWSCTAGILGKHTTEVAAQINIRYSQMGLGGFVSIALTIVLFVIITVSLFVIIVYRRRNRYPDEKPILYK